MKILLVGASGRMGQTIITGLIGQDPDVQPDWGRFVMIEGDIADIRATFMENCRAAFAEKIANWPDDHESGWKESKLKSYINEHSQRHPRQASC